MLRVESTKWVCQAAHSARVMHSIGHVPIGTRFGNYELTAVLGEGGMGTVYAAVHLGLGKRVAIKTLRAQMADDLALRARFLREGKAAAAVRHPNVVDVDDVGFAGDTPYLVMELLEGEPLQRKVARHGRLTAADTLDVLVPVLLALAEAHRAGVVHRDLKPDNIFIARDYHGVTSPKLLDFGISMLQDAHSLQLTHQRALLGTPYYMSPEQAGSSRSVDARSDLYAIGVILYFCTVGRVPFQGSTLAQVIGQIMYEAPAPLRASYADIPPAFEAIVLRCLAKDPAQRYPDALTLARVLLPLASQRLQLTYGPVLLSDGATPLAGSFSARAQSAPPQRWPRVALPLLALLLLAGAAWYVRLPQPKTEPPAPALQVQAPAVSQVSSAPPQPVAGAPAETVAPVISRPAPYSRKRSAPPRAAKPPDRPAAPDQARDDAIWGDRR